MIRTAVCSTIALLLAFMGAPHAQEPPFQGEQSEWHGHACFTFEVAGKPARVATPATPAEGRPWVLCGARDLGPAEEALLDKGYHAVTIELDDLLGGPQSLAGWTALYETMSKTYGMDPSPVLAAHGPSGLLAYNWAADNPKKVACIYAFDPVLDFNTWLAPDEQDADKKAQWSELCKAYGFTSDDQALAYDKNPVERFKALARAHIPFFHVSTPDPPAPYRDNAGAFRERCITFGGGPFEVLGWSSREDRRDEDIAAAIVAFVLAAKERTPWDERVFDIKDFTTWDIAGFSNPGKVRIEDGTAFLEEGNDLTGITWKGPLIRMDYEISVEAMRVAGGDFFCGLTFPYGDSPCSFIVGGWGGTVCGISCLDYNDAYNNETARFVEFENNLWYAIRLRVTKDRIEAWIDGKQIVNAQTTDRKIGIRWEVEPSVPLGIASWRTTGAVRNLRMSPIEK